eukprot:TRINITY_DN13172_c0_g10_i1.p1 TRINITY_DN13172_c0_g10~~TRINITY_DN13172_c0_g10_i1.p1  ORF type:complete len:199 (+),score=7.21 TRINITY_DN13172_c0_g10_i1:125-721(+)
MNAFKRSRCKKHIKLNKLISEEAASSMQEEDITGFNLTLGGASPVSNFSPNGKRRRKFHRISLSTNKSKSIESSPCSAAQHKFFPQIRGESQNFDRVDREKNISYQHSQFANYPFNPKKDMLGDSPLNSAPPSHSRHFDFDIKFLNANKVKLDTLPISSGYTEQGSSLAVGNHRNHNAPEVLFCINVEAIRREWAGIG